MRASRQNIRVKRRNIRAKRRNMRAGRLHGCVSCLHTRATNFNALIVATPTAYGLTTVQATAYTALHTAFVTAYNAANSDSTRTPAGIITKDAAKAALK